MKGGGGEQSYWWDDLGGGGVGRGERFRCKDGHDCIVNMHVYI